MHLSAVRRLVTNLDAFSSKACGFVDTIATAAHSHVSDEVHMAFVRLNNVRATADLVSSILNCICPECGGRMGGCGKEFKCQGECQTDWRLTWERFFSARR